MRYLFLIIVIACYPLSAISSQPFFIFDMIDAITYAQIKSGQSFRYIGIALSADKPYKNWSLDGLHFRYEKNIGLNDNLNSLALS